MIGIKSWKEIGKSCLFLGFEDVLVPGSIEKSFGLGPSREVLENLAGLEKRFGEFRFFVLTGLHEKIALERVEKFGLKKLLGKRFLAVSQEYIDSKKEIDKKLYLKNLKKDKEFKDEFFKQVTIKKLLKEHSVAKKQALLVCNDVWTEGFYTRRFSDIDFAVIESSAASLDKKIDKKIGGLVYLERGWKGFEDAIKWGKNPNYDALDKFVFNTMKERLFEGTKLSGLSKLAK